MNLYQLHDCMKQAEDALSDGASPEDVAQVIDALEIDFRQKCVQIAYFIKNLEGDIDKCKAEELRIADRRKSMQAHYDRLKEYLAEGMIKAGIGKADDGVIGVSCGKPRPMLVIDDEESVPDDYRTIKVSAVIDKKMLLSAIKDGAEVEGAHIGESKPSITIK